MLGHVDRESSMWEGVSEKKWSGGSFFFRRYPQEGIYFPSEKPSGCSHKKSELFSKKILLLQSKTKLTVARSNQLSYGTGGSGRFRTDDLAIAFFFNYCFFASNVYEQDAHHSSGYCPNLTTLFQSLLVVQRMMNTNLPQRVVPVARYYIQFSNRKERCGALLYRLRRIFLNVFNLWSFFRSWKVNFFPEQPAEYNSLCKFCKHQQNSENFRIMLLCTAFNVSCRKTLE